MRPSKRCRISDDALVVNEIKIRERATKYNVDKCIVSITNDQMSDLNDNDQILNTIGIR
jgi:hypothetical protein